MSEKTEEKREKNPHYEEAREHMHAARESMRESVELLIPQGFLEHRRKARKEFLLAVRSMVDAAIDRVDQKLKTE